MHGKTLSAMYLFSCALNLSFRSKVHVCLIVKEKKNVWWLNPCLTLVCLAVILKSTCCFCLVRDSIMKRNRILPKKDPPKKKEMQTQFFTRILMIVLQEAIQKIYAMNCIYASCKPTSKMWWMYQSSNRQWETAEITSNIRHICSFWTES